MEDRVDQWKVTKEFRVEGVPHLPHSTCAGGIALLDDVTRNGDTPFTVAKEASLGLRH